MNVYHKLADHFVNSKKVTGSQICTWLKENSPICESSRVNALLLSERLVEMEFVLNSRDSSLHFTDDEELFTFGGKTDFCLNSTRKWVHPSRHPVEISNDLLRGFYSIFFLFFFIFFFYLFIFYCIFLFNQKKE